jgi:hypothetical protein
MFPRALLLQNKGLNQNWSEIQYFKDPFRIIKIKKNNVKLRINIGQDMN